MNHSRTYGFNKINSIAHMLHNFPFIEEGLKSYEVTDRAKSYGITYNNLLEWTTADGSLHAMKVGLFLKVGADLEEFFKEYYAEKRGVSRTNLTEHLRSLKPKNSKTGRYSHGSIFQRTFSNNPNDQTLQDLYLHEIHVDIESRKDFKAIKEYFAHRHLYTHQNGIPDRKYINTINKILDISTNYELISEIYQIINTNRDTCSNLTIKSPIEKRFWPIIDAARNLISTMPD